MFKLAKLVSLFQKLGVGVMDRLQAGKEVRFRQRHDLTHQVFDGAAARRLWSRCQITANDRFLMEQAQLDRRFWKEPFYQQNRAFSAIYRDAGECPSKRG